ncbi:translin-associated protein X [Metarhizium acridum CQMa 102]|uniref:Translin-associated protein X n=1 Tax=Metarhizium acridum (strain CQMa 102) TaxID=655827 RepID=E9EH30_METAQ|nr:translin-associated protein X [Metarhizium acridum CQMa 102]EFY84775.1 translin-associated protein X [Metarhizium acridum CQMa 102]
MPAGTKRDRDGNARSKSTQDGPRTRFHNMFEDFRDELDEHYDRKERIVKASRDVTAQSKKIVKHINQGLPPSTEKDVAARMGEITALLQSVSPDLQPLNRHRYSYSLRCLEELVEALSFAHYLRHQKLITPQEAAASTPGDIALTPHDYMFGIFDLFGEMMRFATVTTAQNGEMPSGEDGRNILGDIQELGCAFEMLREVPTRDYRSKMEAMRQSVRKVEKLGYGLVVRGSERPKGWVPDMKDDVEGGSP